MDFIKGTREKGCVFCRRRRRRNDREDYILYRGKKSFVILNRYPYNTGHLMVIPNRHLKDLERLTPAERGEILSLIVRANGALRRAFQPQGFNVGLNLGRAAGAGIDNHLHFHVVPRWSADTNFWPVLAETKTMPEHLSQTYGRLKKAWR